MKRIFLFTAFSVFFSVSILFAQPVSIAPTVRDGVINRLSLFTEAPVFNYNTSSYNYDAVLVVMRKVDNRPKKGDEGYDALSYKCFAEARFYDRERKNHISIDSVVVNGLKLTPMQFGSSNYYFTPDKYLHSIPALSPDIKWSVYGGGAVPDYNGESLSSILKFPDFYYIDSYNESAEIGGAGDWNMSVSKWLTGSGFSLQKPDMLRGWILSLANYPSSPLANFSPLIKIDDVSADNYSGKVEGKHNIFDATFVLPGQGCAVVRTYKFYPVKVKSKSGTDYDWLFIMGVESEVPVDFR